MNKALLTGIAITLALAACSADSYDTGDGRYSYLRADFVEAHTLSDGTVDRVLTDNGQSLTLSAPAAAAWSTDRDTTCRALLYYNYEDDTTLPVSAISISAVPVCRPHDMPADSVKTDPVTLQSVWTAQTGRWINLSLDIKVGTVDDDATLQTVGIARTGIRTNADGTRTALLTFYHDQGDVPQYYSSRYYLSIPTDSVRADSAQLTVSTYDGLRTLTVPARSVK